MLGVRYFKGVYLRVYMGADELKASVAPDENRRKGCMGADVFKPLCKTVCNLYESNLRFIFW